MNFTPEMLASMAKVEAAREANIALEPRRMDADEKDGLPSGRLWRNHCRPQCGSEGPGRAF